MTLIASVATSEYVVQVSDRRLTWRTGPKTGQVLDDNSNKVVLFGNRIAFSYTGLAEIENRKTDDWLMRTLSGEPSCLSGSDAANLIRSKATEAFKRIGRLRHAFVGAGWAFLKQNEPAKPVIASISNAQDDSWQWLPEAEEEFKIRYNILPKTELYQAVFTGQRVSKQLITEVGRSLRKIIKRGLGPKPIASILVSAIRAQSVTNSLVGQNLLIVSLPRIACEKAVKVGEVLMLSSAPLRDEMTFFYVPADRGDLIQYGPHIVYQGGGPSIANFEAGTISNNHS